MEQSQYVKPMGFGEILDASVRLYRRNFLSLVIAQLPLTLFYIVNNLVNIYSTGTSGLSFFDTFSQFASPYEPIDVPYEPLNMSYMYVTFLLAFLQIALIYPITLAAVTKVASGSALKTPTSVKDAYKFSLRNWFKLGLTNIIITIAMIVILAIVLIIPFVVLFAVLMYTIAVGPSIGASAGIVIALGIFFIIALLAGGFFLARWVATFPIMVNEKIFALRAMGRSWDMVKGKTTKTFFVLVVVFAIPLILQYSPLGLEFLFLRSLVALTLVFGVIAQGLLIPLVDCARVVIYFELRARKEGFDMERRVEALQ